MKDYKKYKEFVFICFDSKESFTQSASDFIANGYNVDIGHVSSLVVCGCDSKNPFKEITEESWVLTAWK